MARRSRCWKAHLVLALVVTARCSVGQQPQHSGDAPAVRLRELLSRAVDPIAAELGSLRTLLDGIASRLQVQDARLDALQAVLNSQDARLDALNARLDSIGGLNATLVASRDEFITRLDALNTGQDAMNTSLNTRLDELNTRVTSSVAAALQVLPRDCSDLIGAGTGVYTIQPGGYGGDTTSAFCDMDTDGGGWTVFQRRADLLPRQNFFLEWAEYRAGFGNMTGEFWWGLEKLHLMTSVLDRRYELRVDLGDWDGERRHALFQDFRISPETDGYRLSGGDYSGNAGDSLSYHFGQRFSTKDRDQDRSSGHCAQERKGAWWFNSCTHSQLNGEYLSSGTSTGNFRGILWYHWKGWGYSLKTAEMKVRPRHV